LKGGHTASWLRPAEMSGSWWELHLWIVVLSHAASLNLVLIDTGWPRIQKS